ncbi:hypothetical protein [Hydrogenophaga sp.]|uniref:hypothetical protein n=1 Tax=Hydrogenophaga sp. TaxID=1904254 RepID=UPI003AF7EB7F
MKPFLPFLLIPAVAMVGWGLAAYTPDGAMVAVPKISAMEAPPSLGQSAAAPKTDGPVRVRMHALLPPPVVPPRPEELAQRQPVPEVAAILIHGPRRVAQIDGVAMAIGESRGTYRITAIEPDRVLFVQTDLGRTRWVPVTDR